jgi:CHASE2 domain-containing sensor protein
MSTNYTNKHFERILGYGLGLFLLALVGFGGVLLAMRLQSRILLVSGVASVVLGICFGFAAMLYGWWSIVFRPWLRRRRGNF